MMRLGPAVAFTALLIGCGTPADNNGAVVNNGNNGNNGGANNGTNGTAGNNGTPDAGGDDVGPDAGARCTPDSCPDEQVCDSVSGRCVGCLSDNECPENGSCDPDKNECVCGAGYHDCDGACLDDTSPESCGTSCEPCPTDPNGTATCDGGQCSIACNAPLVLDPGSGLCVECLANDGCTDPAASLCTAGSCAPCTAGADCAHIVGATMCDGGTCVECTVADESPCGGNSCDPATNTCTTTPVGSAGACEACAADSECEQDYGCVPMNFQMMSRNQGFCLPLAAGDCSAAGTFPVLVTRTTTSGAMGDFCTINEDLATCEAVGDYGAPCADNADCGAAGLDDGICEPLDFDIAGCTFLCDTTAECPSLSLIGCATGNVDGDKWCGAY